MAGPKITTRAALWTDAARDDLASIADHDAREIRLFKDAIQGGDYSLIDLMADGERIGCAVWSYEQEVDGKWCLVVKAMAARPVPGADVTKVMFETFTGFAKLIGARSILCWTKRNGLARKLENLGAEKRHVLEVAL